MYCINKNFLYFFSPTDLWALILVNICFQGEILGPVTLHLFKEINVTAAFSEKNIYLKYHFFSKIYDGVSYHCFANCTSTKKSC